MPSRNEVQQYATLSDAALLKHRLLMMSGVLPKPGRSNSQGAFDAMTPELRKQLAKMSPAQKREIKLAIDSTEVPGGSRTNPAKNDDGEYDADKVGKLLEFLNGKLQEDDLQAAMDHLDACFPGFMGRRDGAEDDDLDDTDKPAKDEPLPFRGMPRPGGKLVGMDARMRAASSDDYASRFPEAARIRLDPCPPRPR